MNDAVVSWDEIAPKMSGHRDQPSGAVLLGNGFSMNIWSGFKYKHLRDRAGFDASALKLFDDEFDFERVLRDLAIAQRVVAKVAGGDQAPLRERLRRLHQDVRDGLLQAVRTVHPKLADLQQVSTLPATTVGSPFQSPSELDSVSERVGRELARYKAIFTTNYDLLPYWPAPDAQIADYFRSEDPFDLRQARAWNSQDSNKPGLYFLHGALHLARDDASGAEQKLVRDPQTDLLTRLQAVYADGERYSPLFISEGTSDAKLASIRRSPFLSFTLQALSDCSAPLTILGHSLSDQDAHIRKAVERHQDRPVAIGVHVPKDDHPDGNAILRKKGRQILGQISDCSSVHVFDASEHPLTSPHLHCG